MDLRNGSTWRFAVCYAAVPVLLLLPFGRAMLVTMLTLEVLERQLAYASRTYDRGTAHESQIESQLCDVLQQLGTSTQQASRLTAGWQVTNTCSIRLTDGCLCGA